MAYSHGGNVQWGTDGKWTEAECGYWIGKTHIHNENYGLAIKLDRRDDKYYIYAKPLNDSVKDKNLYYDVYTTRYDKDGKVTQTHTVNKFLNVFQVLQVLILLIQVMDTAYTLTQLIFA